MTEETRVEGNVSGRIYFKYFTAGCNVLVLVAIVLLSIVAEVSQASVTLNTLHQYTLHLNSEK